MQTENFTAQQKAFIHDAKYKAQAALGKTLEIQCAGNGPLRKGPIREVEFAGLTYSASGRTYTCVWKVQMGIQKVDGTGEVLRSVKTTHLPLR